MLQWLLLFSESQQPQSENSEAQAAKVNVTPAGAKGLCCVEEQSSGKLQGSATVFAGTSIAFLGGRLSALV